MTHTASTAAETLQKTPSIADDTLNGVAEISEYIGETPRRTNYLLEQKRLPAYKIGNRWYMRKSTHYSYIARLEAEALAGADA